MLDAIELFFTFYRKFISFMFTTYIVEGVSFGMFLVIIALFSLLIINLIARSSAKKGSY